MRVLLLEPYLAGSHRAWAEGYARFSRHDVVVVGHDARFWKWRMGGGFVTMAHAARTALEGAGRPDVVLASDMLHLPAFLGSARDIVGDAPAALYMHENQLTYPPSRFDSSDLTYPIINWASTEVADVVLFNSDFHRTQWFEALPGLLRNFPDYRHEHLVTSVRARSEILPVGVDLRRLDGPRRDDGGPPVILWNQRWEYDKDPDRFLETLRRLHAAGVPFRVILAGENFRNDPAEFRDAAKLLGERVVHYGFADDATYVELLTRADVVVSTARQEFFGISVVEAMYAGAFPVLPRALSYPELVPEALHGDCLYDDEDHPDELLLRALSDPARRAAVARQLRPAMTSFDWSVLAPRYDARLERLATQGR